MSQERTVRRDVTEVAGAPEAPRKVVRETTVERTAVPAGSAGETTNINVVPPDPAAVTGEPAASGRENVSVTTPDGTQVNVTSG